MDVFSFPACSCGGAGGLAWGGAMNPGFEVALGYLLSMSPVSVDKLAIDPGAREWLAREDIHEVTRGPRRMRAHYEELRGEARFDERFAALRRMKARESLRIALRDVAGWASIEDTMRELTHLAELCVRVVCADWLAELTRRWGEPGSEFAVLGMGKLGGEELNYSSDIDVIFFFGAEGEVKPGFTRGEFFTRLAEKIVATFSARDPAGALFRIDVRLRPEGNGGPLVRTLSAMEQYYAGYGETWERMAMIKARIVGGSAGAEELGYELFQRLQVFCYPRAVSHEMLDEVAAIKGRIEREIVGSAELHRNVKLGYGGIREIEFVAQALQLLHGARNAFLQERSTLKALRGLSELGMIPAQDVGDLVEAYRFLRMVEHRLQIPREAQTHTIPAEHGWLAQSLQESCAAFCGAGVLPAVASGALALQPSGEALAWFDAELARHTAAVRRVFDRVIRPATNGEEEVEDLACFADATRAELLLRELQEADHSPRTRRTFARLKPELLRWVAKIADPDQALTHFARFVERYAARSFLYETLTQNPRLLELLVRLFDASRFLSDIVIRRPQLIEEVAHAGDLGTTRTLEQYLQALGQPTEKLDWRDWLRVFRNAQLVRIALRDLLGFATQEQVQAEFSALAEACVVFAMERLGLKERLTVVALGKFGGQELSYGADLDVLFIGEKAEGAAALIRALTQLTPEGRVFRVDTRLRPEGEAGPLVHRLTAFVDYFERGRGQLWEAQALTKARPLGGPDAAKWLPAAQAIWRRAGERKELFAEVAAMLGRVAKERGVGDEWGEFKTGPGGLMQLEFYTQARQMRAAHWQPNTHAALLELGAPAPLLPALMMLRRTEAVLRRVDDAGVARLPGEEGELRRLAVRAGFGSLEEFREAYEAARGAIREHARLG